MFGIRSAKLWELSIRGTTVTPSKSNTTSYDNSSSLAVVHDTVKSLVHLSVTSVIVIAGGSTKQHGFES